VAIDGEEEERACGLVIRAATSRLSGGAPFPLASPRRLNRCSLAQVGLEQTSRSAFASHAVFRDATLYNLSTLSDGALLLW
jgi:hypothetical protein